MHLAANQGIHLSEREVKEMNIVGESRKKLPSRLFIDQSMLRAPLPSVMVTVAKLYVQKNSGSNEWNPVQELN